MSDIHHSNGRDEKAHARLDVVENRVNELEKKDAVTQVQMTGIQTSLAKIDGNTTWLVRLILGGFVAAIAAFIVRGGLNVQ